MKPLTAIILSLAMLTASLSAGAVGGPAFRHLDKAGSGLSYDGVKTMLEDSRGYIWIGTYDGLCRYDGTRVVTYGREELGTSVNYISSLETDADGRIWIGTDDGIVVYDCQSEKFFRPASVDTPFDRVYAIKCDPEGNVWAGVKDKGLYLCRRGSRTLEKVLDRSAESGTSSIGSVFRLAVTLDSRLIFATYCEDLYFLENGEAVKVAGDYFTGDNIEGIDVDPEGMLWVASKSHGLCRVNLRSGSVTQVCPLPKDARPVNVGCSGGAVWFCTTGGLIKYNTSTGTSCLLTADHNNPFSLSDDFVTKAFVSTSGTLWVSTDECGVNFYSPDTDKFSKFCCLDDGRGLETSLVGAFAQDGRGLVWIGTDGDGLLVFEPVSSSLKKYSKTAVPCSVNALLADGNCLWIGANTGIFRMDVGSGAVESFSDPEGYSTARVISIFRSREGELYISTPLGVAKFCGTSFCPVECLRGITVENMDQDATGTVYVASYSNGAYAFDPDTDTMVAEFNVKDGKSVIPEMTSSVCVDSRGRPWIIGFSSGIFAKEGADFKAYNTSNVAAFPSDIFYTGMADLNGHLWLSGDSGLVEFEPDRNTARVYTTSDGLLNNIFRKGGITLQDGRMLFGSENGFVLFDPDKVSGGRISTEVAISGMRVNGKPRRGADLNIDLAEKLVLDSDERSIGFDFATPYAGNRAIDRIFCQLEGYETVWRDVSATRSIEYYNLPKGNYSLKIRVPIPGGGLVQAHPDLEITIKPKFIESWIGWVCIVLSVLVLAALLFSFVYHNALSAQKRKHKAKEDALKDRLYHEKMNFFANVIHEIKTPLTLIRTPLQNLMSSEPDGGAAREDLSLIGNAADYMEKLVKELLEFISLEEHGYVMELKNVDLVEKAGFYCSNFSEAAKTRNLKLTYVHQDESLECAVDGKALSKIVNNLLQNAVKYAESWIQVELKAVDGSALLFFRNDGDIIPESRREDIFKPFVYYQSNDSSQSFGIGLPLARTLAQLHEGSLVLSERTDCNEFVLSLPLRTVPEAVEETEDNQDFQNKPIMLIVEDNTDLLGYLKRKLSEEFKVMGVTSAEAALQKTSKYNVDLILTDIGLKEMNGVEFCSRISSDPRTAHIPVIVLSAISTMKTKVACMENGATMYIEKPFSMDYLISCIKSVMEKRKQMKNAYAGNSMDKVMDDIPDRDEDFLRKLDTIVAEHISDPDFNNTTIEEALYLSHSSLNRRMKALLGTTPNDYIRRKRLALAAQMLSRGGVRINEVCYAVGFNSPSYFAKCFKNEYGVLPAEWIKEKNVAEKEK